MPSRLAADLDAAARFGGDEDGGVTRLAWTSELFEAYDWLAEELRGPGLDAAAYLELHIEQGPVLERAGVDLGIVTAITGVVTFRARLRGEANHAGTTPMDARCDALAGAARAVLALRDEARRRPGMTANVGC